MRELEREYIPGLQMLVRGELPEQFVLRVNHRYRRTSLKEREGCRTNYIQIALPAEPQAVGEPDEAVEVEGGTLPVRVQLPLWAPGRSEHHPAGMPHRSGRILHLGLRVFHIQDRMSY